MNKYELLNLANHHMQQSFRLQQISDRANLEVFKAAHQDAAAWQAELASRYYDQASRLH